MSTTPSDAANELLLRRAARRNLLAFTTYTKPDYRTNWHHRVLAERLDRVATGACRRLMVFMPPQHGKSELVSRRFPAFMLGRNPMLRLIGASNVADLAVAMNRDVQRIIAGERYRMLFPRTQLAGGPKHARGARRTMGFFEVPTFRGWLRSAGVLQPIAGQSADGAIIDDPFGSREDADSPTIRQRIWDWYVNDLYTRLATDAWIVLTHTRWHRDDLAGRLLRKMVDRAADQWEVLALPAVRVEVAGAADDPRQPGEILWPEFKSLADISIIQQQDAKAFAALYQQDPAEASNVEWRAELFGDWIWARPEDWPAEFQMRVVCVDASKGRSDHQGDYCAIVFLGINGTARPMYVDAILERIPIDQIVRKTVLFCDRHRPDFVGIEAEQFQELLVHEFRRQCGEQYSVRWPIFEIVTKGIPKITRIRRLSQYIVNRELRFRGDSPGCRLLVDQLMDFPIGEHDDGPDALEMCIRLPLEVGRG